MQVVVPEIVEPDESLPRDLVALRQFALLMDEAFPIPGTRRRVGLDAALGLIPGVGDAAAALFSLWIVVGALRHRVPLPKVFGMVARIVLDLVIGMIPLLGDAFDFFFKQNRKNVEVLIRHRDRRRQPRTTSEIALIVGGFVMLLLVVTLASIVALVAVAIWLANARGALL